MRLWPPSGTIPTALAQLLVGALAFLLICGPAWADRKRARELYHSGYAHYKQGRYAMALGFFRSAVKHLPKGSRFSRGRNALRFFIGVCLYRLGHRSKARAALTTYLKGPGKGEHRMMAGGLLKVMGTRGAPGRPSSPLPERGKAGSSDPQRKPAVGAPAEPTKVGRKPPKGAEIKTSIRPTRSRTTVVKPGPAVAVAPAVARRVKPPGGGIGVLPWVSVGVGAVALVAGGVSGILATDAANSRDEAYARTGADRATADEIAELHSKATGRKSVATALLVSGGVVAAGGAVWALVLSLRAPARRGRGSLAVTLSGRSLVVRGSF